LGAVALVGTAFGCFCLGIFYRFDYIYYIFRYVQEFVPKKGVKEATIKQKRNIQSPHFIKIIFVMGDQITVKQKEEQDEKITDNDKSPVLCTGDTPYPPYQSTDAIYATWLELNDQIIDYFHIVDTYVDFKRTKWNEKSRLLLENGIVQIRKQHPNTYMSLDFFLYIFNGPSKYSDNKWEEMLINHLFAMCAASAFVDFQLASRSQLAYFDKLIATVRKCLEPPNGCLNFYYAASFMEGQMIKQLACGTLKECTERGKNRRP
jgi:hypothetical protein